MHTTLPLVEALVRWDPAWFVARELAERAELSLPPTVRMAQLVGTRLAIKRAVESAGLAESVERLGPLPLVPSGPPGTSGPPDKALAGQTAGAVGASGVSGEAAPRVQLLLRAGLGDGPALTAALKHMKAVRSARKEREPVGVRVDPMDGLG
jgi:primosomal protein N' (replication factor Y)